jgi:hypothetical protein
MHFKYQRLGMYVAEKEGYTKFYIDISAEI